MTKWVFSRYTRLVNTHIWKEIHVIYHFNRLKKKNHIIISINAKKASDKFQHSFTIRTLRKIGIEENFLNLLKDIYKKTPYSWVAQLVGVSSHTPKGCGFDSQSGHIPRLQVQSQVGTCTEGYWLMFLSHISVCLSRSLKSIQTYP